MTAPFANVHDSGTVSTTEYSIIDKTTTAVPIAHTTACKLTGYISIAAIAAGDVFRLRVYEKVNGLTAAPVYEAYIGGTQPGPTPLPDRWLKEGWDITMLKISGTDRVVHWSYDQDISDANAVTIAASALNLAAIATDARLALGIMRTNTAAGGGAQSVTLDAGASAVDDLYVGALALITAGTGAGGFRRVVDYVGSTKVATVDAPWLGAAPDNTSTFVLIADAGMPELPGRKAITGTLTATAFSTDLAETTTDHWKDAFVTFATGSLAGQVKKVTGYNGTTKVLSFTSGFTGAPSNGDIFYIING